MQPCSRAGFIAIRIRLVQYENCRHEVWVRVGPGGYRPAEAAASSAKCGVWWVDPETLLAPPIVVRVNPAVPGRWDSSPPAHVSHCQGCGLGRDARLTAHDGMLEKVRNNYTHRWQRRDDQAGTRRIHHGKMQIRILIFICSAAHCSTPSASTFFPGGCSLRLRAAAAACWRRTATEVDVRVSFHGGLTGVRLRAGRIRNSAHTAVLEGNDPNSNPSSSCASTPLPSAMPCWRCRPRSY